jgi:hypothetical protein
MARDIGDGIDTTGRVRPEGFVRGVLETRGDHDWYRVELDPGRYVVRLSGTGDDPVGHPLLLVRDENGARLDRSDGLFGESRVGFSINNNRTTLYLDVSGKGPYTVPRDSDGVPGRKVGHATGDFTLSVNRLEDSPLDAIAGSVRLDEPVVDVYFVPDGGSGEIFDGGRTVESSGWNGYQVRQAMAALQAFSQVCDISFRQTHQRAKAELELLTYGQLDPPYSGVFQPPGTIGEGTGIFAAGLDAIVYNDWADRPGGGLERGAPGWGLMLHEFGHGLGLAHPHDPGFGSVVMDGIKPPDEEKSYPFRPGDFGLNDSRFTVMSYRGMGVDDGSRRDYGHAMGPMAFDIAALQQMYGAARSHAGGDSYLLPTRNGLGTGYLCIWDTGGEDTIRAGRTDRNVTIDLNPATLAYEPGGGGFLSSARGVNGGFTIASGVEIENAAAGDGHDRLVGNALDNRLLGGAGADRIQGRAGADRLDAGDDNARDLLVYRALSDSGPRRAEADRIAGFDSRDGRREQTWDRLDLSALDGDADAPGNQPLRLVRSFAPDPGEPPGQVRVERQGDDIHVLIDLDADTTADMRLILRDTPRLGGDDFFL